MATPQKLINESSVSEASHVPVPMIFEKTAQWKGVKVGHYRIEPGQMPAFTLMADEIFVPLDGSVLIEGQEEDGAPSGRRRVAGGAISITPAGVRLSAEWDEELEYVAVFLTEDFLKHATIDFEANRQARIILSCGP